MIGDNKVDPQSLLVRKQITVPIVSAVSLTDVPWFIRKIGFSFDLRRMSVYSRTVAAAAVLDLLIVANNKRVKQAATFTIDAVPEKFAIGISRVIANDVYVVKAATTANLFTAAHVVTASKFGVILVQIDSAGVLTTKCPGATQTTPMAYNTAALALAALPAADANKVALGYIAIAAKAATWTANTDDMTNGSDLTTATFNILAQEAKAITQLTPVQFKEVNATLSATRANVRGGRDDYLVGLMTTDGTGVLTGAIATIEISARPSAGQVRSE